MASRLDLPKEARVELSDFLHKLDEIYGQSFSAVEWRLLFKDMEDLLGEWKFEKVLKDYDDPDLMDLFKQLNLIIDAPITSSDQVDDTYESLKLILEAILPYLSRTWFGVTVWDKIPFFSYFGFALVILVPEYSIAIAFLVTVACLFVTYYCKVSEEKENEAKKEKKTKMHDKRRKDLLTEKFKESEEDSEGQKESSKIVRLVKDKGIQFRIFAAVFGIIAALAITAPLEDLLEDSCISTPTQRCLDDIEKTEDWSGFLMGQQVILIGSFFAIGILFYHCGILALTGELASLVEEGKKIGAFTSSLIIFLEGIVLFVAASSTDDLIQFSLWMSVLLALDIAWLIINLYARIDIMFQWLHLDAILFLFLIFALLLPHQLDSPIAPANATYWAVLIVFLLRTMIDYKIGWRYWTKIPTE